MRARCGPEPSPALGRQRRVCQFKVCLGPRVDGQLKEGKQAGKTGGREGQKLI